MRRLLLLSLIILILSPLSASWQIGADLRCLDSFWYEAVRLDAEASYRFGNLRLTVPLRYSHSLSHELDFLESGLSVSVYPFHGQGFYASVSVIRIGMFSGFEAPEERLMLFSEISAGWTMTFGWFFIEPRLSVLDVFSAEKERLKLLSEAVPQYSKLRFSLIAGVEIP